MVPRMAAATTVSPASRGRWRREREIMILRGNWSYPTNVRFGAGRIAELPEAARAAGITRALFVTDPNLAALPMTRDAMARLEAAGIPARLYSDIRPNPVESSVRAGVDAFKDGHGGRSLDGVVAFGGGSALDAGKLIAFMAGQSRPIWDFEDIGDKWMRADGVIAPVVAGPATAGTGSEV